MNPGSLREIPREREEQPGPNGDGAVLSPEGEGGVPMEHTAPGDWSGRLCGAGQGVWAADTVQGRPSGLEGGPVGTAHLGLDPGSGRWPWARS